MKLSTFITENQEEILKTWDAFARQQLPAAEGMTDLALRDHAKQLLQAIVRDMGSRQNPEEQFQKSLGMADAKSQEESAASIHGSLRQEKQFSMLQLSAEFRALRAAVLRLWGSRKEANIHNDDEWIRFNEAIDQALAESIGSYSARADRARDMFLAVLSHDFRAPLATLSATGHTLSHPMLAQSQLLSIGARVRRTTSLMATMVDDLADYARAQLGNGIPIARQWLDLGEVCAWAVDSAGAVYPQARFDLTAPGESALSGSFDGVRLHRLFTNLLLNAAQHGSRDHPIAMEARGDADAVIVAVTNQGPVIPQSALKDIFKPLVKLHPGSEGEHRRSSMGLGLYIACEIAEAHEGKLAVTSSEEGTTFTVRLPRGPTN